MKKLVLSALGGLVALLPTTTFAKDACPAERQVYEFKSTGKAYNPEMKPDAYGKAAYLKMDGIEGESRDKEHMGSIIKADSGIYIKIGNGIEGEFPDDVKGDVYLAEMSCKK